MSPHMHMMWFGVDNDIPLSTNVDDVTFVAWTVNLEEEEFCIPNHECKLWRHNQYGCHPLRSCFVSTKGNSAGTPSLLRRLSQVKLIHHWISLAVYLYLGSLLSESCASRLREIWRWVYHHFIVIAIGDDYRFAFFGLVTKLWLKFQGLFLLVYRLLTLLFSCKTGLM